MYVIVLRQYWKGAPQMGYDKQQVAEKLNRWERFLGSYRLPDWDDLPQIDLYLDQVIALVNQYLGFFVYDPTEEKLLTPSMVNNYVKQRLIPAPIRKKYGRRHIALLLMICTFKQAVSMAAIGGSSSAARERATSSDSAVLQVP